MPPIFNTTLKPPLQSRRGCRAPLRQSGMQAAPHARLSNQPGSGGGAAHAAAASACAQSTPPRSRGSDAGASMPNISPYTDSENSGNNVLVPLLCRQATAGTRDFARLCCLCRPIALSMESVSSWEEDTAISSASESESGGPTSASLHPTHVSIMAHPMSHERSSGRLAAQRTEGKDDGEGGSTPASLFHRLNARLIRVRRRNRTCASSSCSDGAATFSQQSASASDSSRRRVRPRQLSSRLVAEVATSNSVIDLLSEDWSGGA